MSRIRSIHPGLFTDEAFASLSFPARILVMGLWVEAWDDGVFEWKPLTLKMRIFAADSIDVAPLLAEIEAQGIVQQFTSGAKSFGAIRNFCRYQRPKKPNSSGSLPAELHSFVAFEPVGSEPVPNQFRTGTENRALMEDGGCSKEEKEEKKTRDKRAPAAPAPAAARLHLLAEGVSEEAIADWQRVRSAKRAGPITNTIVEALRREAGLARITVADAVRIATERGWQGFKADWLSQPAKPPDKPSFVAAIDRVAAMQGLFDDRQPRTITSRSAADDPHPDRVLSPGRLLGP